MHTDTDQTTPTAQCPIEDTSALLSISAPEHILCRTAKGESKDSVPTNHEAMWQRKDATKPRKTGSVAVFKVSSRVSVFCVILECRIPVSKQAREGQLGFWVRTKPVTTREC